jgi:preprotein translocase subunit YajC
VEQLVSLLPIVGIALLFWLLIIRPQSKRQRAVREMQSELRPGQEVVLTSGVYGTIEQVTDDHLRLRVADGVTLKVAKGAVGNVVEPTADDRATDTADDEQQPPTGE